MKTGVISRFGIDVENKEEMSWLLDEKAHPNLRIKKLHCHYKCLCAGEESLSTIFGSECTDTDIIRRSYYGSVVRGGMLLVKNIGEYSSNLVNNFIKYSCTLFIDKSLITNQEVIDSTEIQ